MLDGQRIRDSASELAEIEFKIDGRPLTKFEEYYRPVIVDDFMKDCTRYLCRLMGIPLSDILKQHLD